MHMTLLMSMFTEYDRAFACVIDLYDHGDSCFIMLLSIGLLIYRFIGFWPSCVLEGKIF